MSALGTSRKKRTGTCGAVQKHRKYERGVHIGIVQGLEESRGSRSIR